MFELVDSDGASTDELNIEAGSLDDDALDACITDLIAVEQRTRGHLLRLLGERAARDKSVRRPLATPAWYAHVAVAFTVAARRRVETGVRLRDLPVLDAALSAGRVNADHVRLLAGACFAPRVGAKVRDLLELLITLAESTTNIEYFRA